MDKTSTEGMHLMSGGKVVTAEDLKRHLEMSKNGQLHGMSSFKVKNLYYDNEGSPVKFDYETKKAYVVRDGMWTLSDEYTEMLGSDLSALPRDYYYKDNFPMSAEDEKKKSNSMGLTDSVKSGTFGFVVADAMGVPIEFTNRNNNPKSFLSEMVGYGSHKVPAGTWSDDSSMTIAGLDSVGDCNGEIDFNDIMKKYCDWSFGAKYTTTDEVFDIGIGTSRALSNFKNGVRPATSCGGTDVFNNGNGSLMRMLPMVYYLYSNNLSENEEVDLINGFSSLTHGHEISKLGCKIYYDYMKQILDGKSKEEAYESLSDIDYSKFYSKDSISKYSRILDGNLVSIDRDEISSSGYVVSTLEASLWTILNTDSYEDAVVNSINLGEDTDTVGAITGSIAGVLYGYENIPNRWLSKLGKKDYLDSICTKFSSSLERTDSLRNPYSVRSEMNQLFASTDNNNNLEDKKGISI